MERCAQAAADTGRVHQQHLGPMIRNSHQNGMARNINYAVLCALLLSACGVNKIPETSDIKSSLLDQFGGCKYVKLSDVKKINGRDLGSNRYSVQQEFELELIPESKYEQEVDRLAAAGVVYKRLSDDYDQRRNQLTEANTADVDKTAKAEQQIHNEHAELIATLRSPADLRQAQDAYKAALDALLQGSAERRRQYETAQPKALEEHKAQLVAAGFPMSPNGIPRSPEVDERELLGAIIKNFDTTCHQIKWPGKAMVLQVAGLNPYKQMIALSKGVKGKLTETVTYVKTENGWLRQ